MSSILCRGTALLAMVLWSAAGCVQSDDAQKAPPPDGGESQGQQPVPVTGTNLADYSNTRVRCDYQSASTANTYNAQCSVVAHQANGQEYFATGLANGVTLSWQPPQSTTGSMSFNNCNPNSDQLTYQCAVTVNSTATPAQATFAVQVMDAASPPQTQSASLLLPYSVGVAGGFVPSMPFQYVPQANGTAPTPATNLTSTSDLLGFQEFTFALNATPTTYPLGIALCGSTLYYNSGTSIFKVSNNTVSFFGGSPNSQDTANQTTDATRVYLAPGSLACAPNGGGIYVAAQTSQIYLINASGSISLIAGNGNSTDSPDGGLAIDSSINHPSRLAVTSAGDVVFTEQNSNLVRMASHTGLLQTIAGTGSAGYSGDGGKATLATLNQPVGITVGPDDSIYFTEQSNAVVRKVTPAGIISTVAGTGTQRYLDTTVNPLDLAEPVSVYVDATNNIYIGEAFRGIKMMSASGKLTQFISGGPDVSSSTGAMLTGIQQAANQREYSTDANIVDGRPGFWYLAVGSNGTFYVDGYEGVLAYPPNTSSPTIYVGAADSPPADCNGAKPAFMTRFYEASAIAILPNDQLAVLDYQSQSSSQLLLHTLTLGSNANADTAVATLGCRPTAPLVGFNQYVWLTGYANNTIGGMVAGSDGSLYIANAGQNLILKVSPQGSIATLAGTGSAAYTTDGAVASTAAIETPLGIALGADGSVYFVEFGPTLTENNNGSRIRRINPQGILSTIAGTGGLGDSGEGLPATQAQITASGIAIDKTGRVFIADQFNNKIKMIDTAGDMHTIAGGGTLPITSAGVPGLQAQLAQPSQIAVTNDGTLYLINFASNQVLEMKQNADTTWNVMTFFGAQRSTDCGTSRLNGVATSGGITAALNSSLSIICQGEPRAISISDTCPASGGSTRIAITQGVDNYANIIEVVKPCGT